MIVYGVYARGSRPLVRVCWVVRGNGGEMGEREKRVEPCLEGFLGFIVSYWLGLGLRVRFRHSVVMVRGLGNMKNKFISVYMNKK